MNQKLIKIVNLLPELLETYGDRGNVATLSWRLSKRGIANEVINASAYEQLPNDGDFYFLGGGEDDAQVAAVELLRKQGTLTNALQNGAQIFAVCAGFQLLGTSFPASGNRTIEGLSLLPVITEPATSRSVGELLTDSTITESLNGSATSFVIGKLTGFENHAGQTRFVEKLQPLGTVVKGIGNHIKEASDGAVTEQIIATYMHGPALVRNPKLADYLLSRKLGELEPIRNLIEDPNAKNSEDQIFNELHDSCVARALK
jgi:CobQ-like glutamine amidotransferase family enzyme